MGIFNNIPSERSDKKKDYIIDRINDNSEQFYDDNDNQNMNESFYDYIIYGTDNESNTNILILKILLVFSFLLNIYLWQSNDYLSSSERNNLMQRINMLSQSPIN